MPSHLSGSRINVTWRWTAGLEMTWDHPGVATVACTTAEMVDEGRFFRNAIYGYDFLDQGY